MHAVLKYSNNVSSKATYMVFKVFYNVMHSLRTEPMTFALPYDALNCKKYFNIIFY